MGLFGKKKKIDSGLDIPPAPPPVKATEETPAEMELPEFPSIPDIPPPGKGLPSFEEGLKKEKRAPRIKDSIEKEIPPPMEEMPPIGEGMGMPPPPMGDMEMPPSPGEGIDMPPPPGMGMPPPPMEFPGAPPAMEVPPPPAEEASEEEVEMPPSPEEGPPQMPSFDSVEEEISEEESTTMPTGPIFIRADNYVYVLDELNVARNIAKESSDIFSQIESLNTGNEQEYENWRLCLEDVERKLLYADKSLFGGG